MTCLVRTWRSGWSYCACSYFSRLSTQPDYWSRRIRSASSSCDGHQDEDRKNSPVVEKEAVPHEIQKLLTSIQEGDRASLAKAITLVESKQLAKYKQGQWLLSQLLVQRGKKRARLGRPPSSTVRVGLSGPPGAGKSTLVESLGLKLVEKGHRVAVLAVDPSSSRTGGSILGDKTRMVRLAREPSAYIRPSPSSGSLGGVTRSTNEAIILCEGGGYDVVLVETVGVGQSEISVSNMVDVFVLVIPPAAGDELQGIKRGIMEVSDIIVVNKADGDLLPAARRIKADYVSAVKLSRSKSRHWKTRVMMASALCDEGVDVIWDSIEEFVNTMKKVDEFELKRRLQQRLWMWNCLDQGLMHRFRSQPGMSKEIQAMEDEVLRGNIAPGTAADILLDKFSRISN